MRMGASRKKEPYYDVVPWFSDGHATKAAREPRHKTVLALLHSSLPAENRVLALLTIIRPSVMNVNTPALPHLREHRRVNLTVSLGANACAYDTGAQNAKDTTGT